MKRLSALPIMIIAQLFASEQGQLGGGDPGLLDFWNRLYNNVGQFLAILPDDGHDPFLRYKEFIPGENLQGIIKTQTLVFRPVVIPAKQHFISTTD